MFKDVEVELNVWTWLYSPESEDNAHFTKLQKKYEKTSPHIIRDTDFEVCLLLKEMKNYNDDEYHTGLVISFIRDFISLYKNKGMNVAANIVLLGEWLTKRYSYYEYNTMMDLIDKEYPQYKDDIEKYMVMI